MLDLFPSCTALDFMIFPMGGSREPWNSRSERDHLVLPFPFKNEESEAQKEEGFFFFFLSLTRIELQR